MVEEELASCERILCAISPSRTETFIPLNGRRRPNANVRRSAFRCALLVISRISSILRRQTRSRISPTHRSIVMSAATDSSCGELSEAKHLCLLRCAGSVGNHSEILREACPERSRRLRMTFMREPLNRLNSPAQLTHCSYGASAQCAIKKHFRFQP